jgi:uncharacterized LabA/DUF88 family protein
VNRGKGLWLIDGGYLFAAQRTLPGYQFDYRRLRDYVEQDGPLWRAYYLNSTSSQLADQQGSFHNWLQSAPPTGPKIITKLYDLKRVRADSAYCERCQTKVTLSCPHTGDGNLHPLHNEQQKGVDVGLATLALTLAGEYETLVLSSGDGDLIDATTTWQIAFWDAMLVTAARKAGAAVLWSEDLNDGQAFGGTVVRNPFRCERSAGATAAPRRGSRRSSTPGPPGPASRSKRPT